MPLGCRLKIEKQFWEESYEQTNDNQTAVERKANGKQKPFYFEGSRKRLRSKILWEKEAQRSEKCGDACGAARDAKFVPTRSIAKYSPLYFVPKFRGLCEAFYQRNNKET